MATTKNYFGLGPADTKAKQAEGTTSLGLPASWYTSVEMYELERRAIFSKKWLLTTHTSRFDKTGDWIRYYIAGFPFVLVKDREGKINAFHNVCRHRAFPIVTEDQGTSRIFSCKYHGWSYGLNGKLAKAPGYQDLDGFDKSKNNLFPIHVHVDDNGFIWINMDAAETPAISWEDDFAEIADHNPFDNVNWESYQFDHTWETEGVFNWKVLAESYDQTAKSDLTSIVDLGSSAPDQIDTGLKAATTYLYPNAAITVSPQSVFMKRFVPTSPTTCAMRYEVYRNKNVSDEDFEVINEAYKRVMSEEKDSFTSIQQDLNDEVVPNSRKDSVLFQTVVRDLVQGHFNQEKETGREIWPARQQLPPAAATTQEDMDFCSELEAKDCSTVAGDGGSGCCGGTACQQPAEALAF